MNHSLHAVIIMFVMSTNAQAADDWYFLVSPYLWFAGVKGNLSTIPDALATEIDVSPIDALKGTEASFMLMLEAKKKRHGFLFDIFYSDVLQENETNVVGSSSWKASAQDTLVTTGYTYELYRTPQAVVSVIGGLRYWQVSTKLTLRSGLDSATDVSFQNSESWVDPLAGVDAKIRLGNSPVYIASFLGGGGASGGSDSFYDLSVNVGYQLTDNIVTSIGYRRFDVDYENGSFVYDVKQEGWVLGMMWVFGTNKLALPDQ